MPRTYERTIAGRSLTMETGKMAGQADGAVLVRYGDTVVLVTACATEQPREGIDFFPLTIDYEERLYAAGKIPGSFFRREGRPTTEAVLAARLTDRPLRPLFPKGFRNDVQIVITVLSADQENSPDVLGTIGASTARLRLQHPLRGAGQLRSRRLRRRRIRNHADLFAAQGQRPQPHHRQHRRSGDDGRGGRQRRLRRGHPGRHSRRP